MQVLHSRSPAVANMHSAIACALAAPLAAMAPQSNSKSLLCMHQVISICFDTQLIQLRQKCLHNAAKQDGSHSVIDMQMAVELLTAQHTACEVAEQLKRTKGALAEAKMRQQIRLCGALDAQLKAAHGAIDAGAGAAKEWRAQADNLLQEFSSHLSGASRSSGEGSYRMYS